MAGAWAAEALESRVLLAATIVKDITPAVRAVETSQLTDVNGTAYFVAQRNAYTSSNDLYRSDGTEAGTTLIRSFLGGSHGPQSLTASGGLLYYRVGVQGPSQIWRTDGTQGGTFAVTNFTYSGTVQQNLADVDGTLYFGVDRGTIDRELWRSDGTAAGTVLVKAIPIGGSYVNRMPANLTSANGTLFFTLQDDAHGIELWRSDGTPSGTGIVRDVQPGTASSNPRNLVNVNGVLYFTANDGVGGEELWRSDGTAAGTVRVADVYPGAASAAPSELTAFNNALYFVARTPGATAAAPPDAELWRTDGTPGGTAMVRDLWPGPNGSAPSTLRPFNGALYFYATTPDPAAPGGPGARQMWRTNGTDAGTARVAGENPALAAGDLATFTTAGGLAYFGGPDGTLWRSDGTPAGTWRLNPPFPANAATLKAVGPKVYFKASEPHGAKPMYQTNGTDAGTARVHRFVETPSSSELNLVTSYRGNLFFESGGKLWRSDGTDAGTVDTGFTGSGAVRSGGSLYYTAPVAGSSRVSLRRTDGTAGGDVVLVAGGVVAGSTVDVDGTLYFQSDHGGQNGLWTTDGTPAGTRFLRAFGYAALFTRMGGAVYFYAEEAATGGELWRTDGTPQGTVLVKDVRPGAAGSLATGHSRRMGVSAAGDRLYFLADDGVHGAEVWTSDGTAAGTALLKDINPGAANGVETHASHRFGYFGEINGRIVFQAAQGPANTQGTSALWSTDGTADGTVKINDRNGRGFRPYGFTQAAGTLFFAAYSGIRSYELWRTDGTAAGTTMLADIPTPNESESQGIAFPAAVGGKLHFVARSGIADRQWTSDGTAGGTQVLDPTPVVRGGGSGPVLVDGTMFFIGIDADHGTEL